MEEEKKYSFGTQFSDFVFLNAFLVVLTIIFNFQSHESAMKFNHTMLIIVIPLNVFFAFLFIKVNLCEDYLEILYPLIFWKRGKIYFYKDMESIHLFSTGKDRVLRIIFLNKKKVNKLGFGMRSNEYPEIKSFLKDRNVTFISEL